MTKYPKISVITPSYNQGQFIEETILSVIGQNYPDLEYIIIDGASSDATLDVIRKYQKNIDIIISEKDLGQSNAINKGFKLATGEIICWLNSDDMFTSNALFSIADIYMDEGFDFLYGDGIKKYEYGLMKGRSKLIKIGLLKKDELTYRDPLQQPSTFWSRSALNKVGLLDESLHYAFDWDFFIRINKSFKFKYHAQALSIYRIHKLHKSGGGGYSRAIEIQEVATRYADNERIWIYNYIIQNYTKARKMKRIFRRYAYIFFFIFSPSLYFKVKPDGFKYPMRMI
jgi:glycosyltransferase involved in cell wall biosynthesis